LLRVRAVALVRDPPDNYRVNDYGLTSPTDRRNRALSVAVVVWRCSLERRKGLADLALQSDDENALRRGPGVLEYSA